MTVGDLLDLMERIKELEKCAKIIQENRDAYLFPDKELENLYELIRIYRARVIE